MSPAPKPAQPPSALRVLLLHHLVTAATVSGLLAIGVWGYLTWRAHQEHPERDAPRQRSPLRAPLIQSQQAKIALAVRAFYEVHDDYPGSLDELVLEGWLAPHDLTYPDANVSYAFTIKRDLVWVSAQDATQAPADASLTPAAQASPQTSPSKAEGGERSDAKRSGRRAKPTP